MRWKIFLVLVSMVFVAMLVGCDNDSGSGILNPDTAPEASIDRFSPEAGALFVRDGMNGLPGPNEPIDFDMAPFITQGLGPDGQPIQYYNFDVQPQQTAPIYVLFREGEDTPVEEQLNIIDDIPGDVDYSDFWHVHFVTVPANYRANSITSLNELLATGYPIERTNMVVNCPVVPEGSTAALRLNGGYNGLIRGWYRNQVVYYFDFSEKMITVDLPPQGHPDMPLSDILVSFNINPDQPGGGPPSGFMTEPGTDQTHNVVATLPADADYSPFWDVDVYDNGDFDSVMDLQSAQAATILGTGVALVNCPVVAISMDPDTAPEASIDRFSPEAGTLFVRDGMNGLPAADEPVDFDMGPFITRGLGPAGEHIQYYNFDVQPQQTAPIYVLFREGEDTPVEGQLNIVDDIPGDVDYSDFWHVHFVTVPAGYLANSITSLDELLAAGYPIERTNTVVNCPVVPEGSTAALRLNGAFNGLIQGWYRNQVVYYFDFSEKMITVDLPPEGSPDMPLSDILVSFNINPDQPGGGPPSGFMTEPGTDQTHNVVATLPADSDYSPFWDVDVYDNGDFDSVMDLQSAQAATILGTGVALVNCPVVSIE